MNALPPRTLVILAAALGWNLMEKHRPRTRLVFRPVAPGPSRRQHHCSASAMLRTMSLILR